MATPSVLERFEAKVRKTDNCWFWTASTQGRGYGQFYYEGRVQLAHRVAWIMHHGPIPDGMVIDHVCHNTLCVNPEHLRLATIKANVENCGGARACNKTSGFRGVRPTPQGRWMARVGHQGRQIYVGVFDTVEEAAQAAAAKRTELYAFPDYEPQAA